MATVTITLTDEDNDQVNIAVEFDPALDVRDPGSEATGAQGTAFEMLDAVASPDDIKAS
jgi:hypothetical protein